MKISRIILGKQALFALVFVASFVFVGQTAFAATTVDIRANNQDGPITVTPGSNVALTWSATEANSCTVTPGGYTGTSGSAMTGALSSSQTYLVICYGPNGQTASDQVVVNVQSAPQISADIKANGQDGPVAISYNTSANLSWTSQSANSCTVTPGGHTGTSGSASTGNLTNSQTYTLICYGAGGQSASDQVVVNVQSAPQISADIKANGQDGPVTIQSGQTATLSWTSQNANSCSVNPGGFVGTQNSGVTVGPLTSSQTYTLVCTNSSGQTASDQVVINVQQSAIAADIRANGQDGPITINSGQTAVLSWTSQNANSCSVNPGGFLGTQNSGITVGPLTTSQTYTITCTNTSGQQATDSVTINVAGTGITADIRANGQDGPITINSGQTAILSWTSSGATSCSVNPGGFLGTQNSGITVGPLYNSQTYVLTCTNTSGQQATDQVTVNVGGGGITADIRVNGQDGPITINGGQSVVLSWTSSGATSCTVNPGGFLGTQNSGITVGPLTNSQTYVLTCTNTSGQQATDSATVNVIGGGITADIRANGQDGPITINSGQTVILSWTSTGANFCSVNPGGFLGAQNSGITVGPLYNSQTYVLTCTNTSGQQATDQVTVNVGGGGITADIRANGQDGFVTISSGQTVILSWTSSGANSCTVNPGGFLGTQNSGITVGPLYNTQTYVLTCTNTSGQQATDQVTVSVGGGSITADIRANGQDGYVTITSGQTAILSWTSSGATSCTVNPGGFLGTQNSGITVGPLYNTQTYVLTCTNSSGQQATDSVTVSVGGTGGLTADIRANGSDGPVLVPYGQTATISWTSSGATYCTVNPGGFIGTYNTGVSTGNLYTSQTYILNCSNGSGQTAVDYVTVNVQGQQTYITVDIRANGQDGPITVPPGSSVTLSWTSSGATQCTASNGWSGTQPLSGSQYVAPVSATTYVITCTNGTNLATDSVTVFVSGGTTGSAQITKLALNQTLGQTVFVNSVEAQPGDIVEFEIRVRNTNAVATTMTVRDILPTELVYLTGSTLVNGSPAADGIATSAGLSLGTLNPNEERIIRFRTQVLAGATYRTVTNQATAIAGTGAANDGLATVVIRQRGQVLGVADIVTGPEDQIPWLLFFGFIGSVIAHVVVFKRGGFWFPGLATENGIVTDPAAQIARELDTRLAAMRARELRPDTE